MNTIAFRLQPRKDRPEAQCVHILVDGRDLLQWLAAIELPSATAEGHPEIAGAYDGLAADARVLPPSEHFLGRGVREMYSAHGKVQLLGCECGESGCWPFLARVVADEERVSWSDFEQPHRSGRGAASRWNYGQLGPFEFSRREYDEALAALGREATG